MTDSESALSAKVNEMQSKDEKAEAVEGFGRFIYRLLRVFGIKDVTPEFVADRMPIWIANTLSVAKDRMLGTAGSFVLCHGEDRQASRMHGGNHFVVLSRRGSKVSDEGKWALFGGFMNIGTHKEVGEQPADGAVRELCEEAIDDKGNPIIRPDASRMKFIHGGIDYKNKIGRPVMVFGHELELTRQELQSFRDHAGKIANDPGYAQRSREASGLETQDIVVMSLRDAMKLTQEEFAHPHEWTALQKLGERFSAKSHGVER